MIPEFYSKRPNFYRITLKYHRNSTHKHKGETMSYEHRLIYLHIVINLQCWLHCMIFDYLSYSIIISSTFFVFFFSCLARKQLELFNEFSLITVNTHRLCGIALQYSILVFISSVLRLPTGAWLTDQKIKKNTSQHKTNTFLIVFKV